MDSIKHHTKLTARERDLIAVWRGGDTGIREIARRLKKSPSTISDEIKRNSYKGHYVAIHAQALTEKRKFEARRRHPLKSPEVYAYILAKLKNGWSPELIAGRLKKKHGKTVICHETIYRFIYARENKDKKLWEYLPRKKKKRRKRYGRNVRRERIFDRTSIHTRPKEVNERKIFGHWEGDSVVGKRTSTYGIRTEVERLSRLTQARLVPDLTAQETIKAQKKIFGKYPEHARASTTLDNGSEHVKHTELKKDLSMQTYFADPYRAGQRGTNEFHNGLIRRYLPKGTDFSELTQEELDDIIQEINNRPRKVLNYNTPQEVFDSYLSVRIQS